MSDFAPSPPPPAKKMNTLAIISLVTGILGLLISCVSYFVVFTFICAGLLSPAALITGIISLNQIKKSNETESGKGMAIAGTIIGAINTLGVCVYTILVLLVIMGVVALPFLDPSSYGLSY